VCAFYLSGLKYNSVVLVELKKCLVSADLSVAFSICSCSQKISKDDLTLRILQITAMYAADERVLSWAKTCLSQSKSLPLCFRMWVYLPFMHSEILEDQKTCVKSIEDLVNEVETGVESSESQQFATNMLDYAKRHQVIVEKYGRFPHRNAILGRSNTSQEDIGLRDGTIESF